MPDTTRYTPDYKRPSLARRLVAGLILLNLLIVAGTLFALYQSKRQFEAQAVTNTQNLTKVLVASLSGLVNEIDYVLRVSVDEIQRQQFHVAAGQQKINDYLKLQHQRLPDIYNLRVTDAAGTLRYGSDFSALPQVNYADRNYFVRLRDDPASSLFIDQPVLGKTTHKWLLTFARRLNRPDGSFNGVVYATINLDHFDELFSVIDVGAGGSIALRDDEWRLIARYPAFKQPGIGIGNKQRSIPFDRAIRLNPEKGVYHSDATSIDSIMRIHSYQKLKDYPLYVNVGIAEQDYLAPWYKEMWEAISLDVAFIFASVLFSILLIRAMRLQQAAEDRLSVQKEYLQAIFETEPECVKVVAADGKLLDMNAAGLRMLEVESLEEARNAGLVGFIAPEHREAFMALHRRVIAGNSGMCEFQIKGRKGTVRWLETHATPLCDAHGKVVSLLGVTRDVTERRIFQQQLEQQAHADSLTGLNNRGHFLQLAELELGRAVRYHNELSIFMLDIDFFKQINDTHGHKAGDRVLVKLAEVCRNTLREVDIIGRLGGEEFAMLLPETSEVEAAEVAERLRVSIESTEVPIESGVPIRITVSIGVASLRSKDDNLDLLLSKADGALYDAKHQGRNRVCVATR